MDLEIDQMKSSPLPEPGWEPPSAPTGSASAPLTWICCTTWWPRRSGSMPTTPSWTMRSPPGWLRAAGSPVP